MEWWVFWMLFGAIFVGCGRMCGWGRRRDHRQREEDRLQVGGDRGDVSAIAGRAVFRSAERPEPEHASLKSNETPLQTLQNNFVDGRISMEEYERRLDQLERL